MTDKNLTELIECSVDDYVKELSKLEPVEDRISKMLGYMKLQLSHGEIHPLSRFWKMRKFCLDHFKCTISVSQRLKLWKDYCTVIEEIVKLKQIIDEKSAFEREQIEEALLSIASDLEQMDELVEKEPEVSVPKCQCVQKHANFYKTTQKELGVYSSYAKRLNALKKEILALDISFKKKQEILDQIHSLADRVFPKKRDLLNLMSKTYTTDIQNFVRANFSSGDFKTPIFQLKEQIKQLQNFAKVISLNVEAFSKTREQLSDCWDNIKLFEKRQKKDKEERKELSNKKFSSLQEKIVKLKEGKEALATAQFNTEIKILNSSIHKEDLLKFQRKQLLDEIILIDENGVRDESLNSQNSPAHETGGQLRKILEQVKGWDYQTIDSKLKSILNEYDSSNVSDAQHIKIERNIYALYEALSEKLMEEIKDRIDFEEISTQIENFKKAMKKNIDGYRKVLNTSNQSIEKAIVFNELLVQSRALLGSIEEHLAKHQAQA